MATYEELPELLKELRDLRPHLDEIEDRIIAMANDPNDVREKISLTEVVTRDYQRELDRKRKRDS